MNSSSLINLVLLYFKLNSGIGNDAKVIMKEGMDVINSLTKALKDADKVKILDLSSQQLTSLSEEIGQLTILGINW